MIWNSVRILDLRDGKVTPIPPPTFRDQFMRTGRWTGRLCHASRRHFALRSSSRRKGCAQARAGRARGLPRLNGNSTVQFGWPTIADFIRRNVQCVRQPAPHRRQSVVSAAGGCTRKFRSKTCASMAGRHCQRSERLRSQSRWLFDDTGRCAEEVSRKQSR